ncbi:Eco57I restriction-modification methylase domain-containing protein [Alkalispirochaeta alkalica]|uniref:Eco57I restriction-modification methylase domain-containing protein n=1 Tax=Alkalispirochaeta alkalica TaxID=46356 RepID=UPI000378E5C6|nr:DNA methyltransferase [Alkalispirochaeta alkalica]
MATQRIDPHVLAHNEWLGFVRPTGLVVSSSALIRMGVILDRRGREAQQLLQQVVSKPDQVVPTFSEFAETVLGWDLNSRYYLGTESQPIPDELAVHLPDYNETLRPDFAVLERDPREGAPPWQLLVQIHPADTDLDKPQRGTGLWDASPHSRMERLLRRTNVPAGLLWNGTVLRLVSAPYGESSGWLDFRIPDMLETAGRPICNAMRLLLGQPRLLTGDASHRLIPLLRESRKYQNEVSERLSEQVLHALYELVRGFQAAQDLSRGELLREVLREHPEKSYRGLLTVILRVVFLLYAEEREMFPDDDVFQQHYSIAGLYERLREDVVQYSDTMDQRYGAWAQLLVLFRIVYDGARTGRFSIPQRHGVLFDPDRYPFLEGRPECSARQVDERLEPPLVPDGTIYRILEKLLVLDGERISYRALDVEQIGSVYETMMGFRLEQATGRSIAIKAPKRRGAPTTVNLEELLRTSPSKRQKWLQDRTTRKITDKVKKAVDSATSIEALHDALEPVVDIAATPDIVAPGAMVLQPSEERRKSGSQYTPRTLTEPIVRKTLEPLLERIKGEGQPAPAPEAILEIKVLDPAMGSGAFLVESCRQLADALVESWHAHEITIEVPPDEDEVVYARRLVAQRCIYGVDRNPMAVDLAKVSLWLVTLAKDHPLTFVDHALRHGDSLVGLSREQIRKFHWDTKANEPQYYFEREGTKRHIDAVGELRRQIREAGEDVATEELQRLWTESQAEVDQIRLGADLVTAAYFSADKPKERKAKRFTFAGQLMDGKGEQYRSWLEEMRQEETPLAPFHWEIEFPEVFDRENPGFDAIVGNPPFLGGRNLSALQGSRYLEWLASVFTDANGGADLTAYFFRRSFDLLRPKGTMGLIATNTIAQGDTRSTGLRWICNNGGEIFSVTKRLKWPGEAAVVVSVVHLSKGQWNGPRDLDGTDVDRITAYLVPRGGNDDPARLAANSGKSFQGSIVLGMGFTFDDTDKKGVATPIAEMERLIAENPRNQAVIFPYIGGQEINTSPTHEHHRYVINFWERDADVCRQNWPSLWQIIEEKVRPERSKKDAKKYPRMVYEYWKFWNPRIELQNAISGLDRVLARSLTSKNFAFAFLPKGMVYDQTLIVFAFDAYAPFCTLSSSVHNIWSDFQSGTLEDRPRYNITASFDPFPFPPDWETNPDLEAAGKAYYEYRADLMVRTNLGLTKTYNRFHDPDETDPEILKMRELHTAMDRAVLDTYGWNDIPTHCDFIPDYEDDDDSGKKKKPWRYRWPDDVRDEVLARLLELNARRAREESLAGAGKRTGDSVPPSEPSVGNLFTEGELFS